MAQQSQQPSQSDQPAKPFMNYSIVATYFARNNPNLAADAMAEFDDLIGYDGSYLPQDEMDRLDGFSMEWFIFDYRFPNGQTAIEQYLSLAGSKLSKKRAKDLREAVATQFVSGFWLVSASAADHTVVLEDARTGERYDVLDYTLSQSLDGSDGGVLNARLAKIRGTWYFPGEIVSFRPIKPTERMKTMLRGESANGERLTFAECVAMEMGFRRDVADQYGSPDGGPVGGGAASQPYLPPSSEDLRNMTPQERQAEVDLLHSTYDELHDRLGLRYDWDELCEAIRKEGGDESKAAAQAAGFTEPEDANVATDMLRVLTALLPAEDSPTMTMDALNEVLAVVAPCWNMLPHDSLGGKAPYEIDASDAYDGLFDEERFFDDETAARHGQAADGGERSGAERSGDSNNWLKTPLQWWNADVARAIAERSAEPQSDVDLPLPCGDSRNGFLVDVDMILDHFLDGIGDDELAAAYEDFHEMTGALEPESRVDVETDAYETAADEWVAFDWRPHTGEAAKRAVAGPDDVIGAGTALEEFAFERNDHGDTHLTPLEYFVAHPPAGFAADELARLRDIARTQITSLYWVRGVDEDRRQVTLEDVLTGTRYPVRDERLAVFLAPTGSNVGLIGVRIAQVDGVWMMPTEPVLSLPIASDDSWRRIHRDRFQDVEAAGPWTFENLCCSQFDDITEERTLKQYHRMPFLKADAATSAAERERLDAMVMALLPIRQEYDALCLIADLLTTWEDLAVAIWRAPLREHPEDLFEDLYDTVGDIHVLDCDSACDKLHEIFMRAWNALPHRAYGNQTPAEAGMTA
ncbi:hypothetical protein [Bifidobacterium leontopitheci]|uniref:Uncharacterized protein n=1 Tax=Bifidobacterium leontopitheci TaxID=2650774 RepID=A0A6I1GFM4_9BIFI|nr:hypothetical protein [Bifidobacterium leontopitheci]KAB7790345.1 hypothetical protein F7D09_1154 [Bifidobacterium leontopitheci]